MREKREEGRGRGKRSVEGIRMGTMGHGGDYKPGDDGLKTEDLE